MTILLFVSLGEPDQVDRSSPVWAKWSWMNDDQCAFLRTILIKSYHHNVRIKNMEVAARGLVRLGGHEREISLHCLRFELVEEVLDFLGVPADESQRKQFRFWLERAGMKEPPPARVEKAIRRIEKQVAEMFN